MGRTCLICCRERPNERFGGRGYGARVCKECRKLSKSEQKRILAENEIVGFLDQKNISAKNIRRLEDLASIEDPEFQSLRRLILEIAQVAPRKRKRWQILRSQYPLLYYRVVVSELIEDNEQWFDRDTGFEGYDSIDDDEFFNLQLDWLNQELRWYSSDVPPLEILPNDDRQMIATVNRLLREAADIQYEW